jgi:hypothetical protein
LETAFTISPKAGNSNNGAVDWTFNYKGGVGDLDFIAGRTITVTNTVQVADQDGNTATSTVTNTLSLPPTGIDFRYTSAQEPLSATDISNTFTFVGQYLGGSSSYLTLPEAEHYTAAGLKIFSIYETAGGATASYFTSNQGYADGLAAVKDAEKVSRITTMRASSCGTETALRWLTCTMRKRKAVERRPTS